MLFTTLTTHPEYKVWYYTDMDISFDALVVLAQIIPILLLASYFDRDALNKISTYSRRIQYYWFGVISFILVGELVALFALVDGEINGWRGAVVFFAAVLAVINLFSIAGWRVLGLDLVSGLPIKKKRPSKK